ncbi:unnamed protein product, partial [Protopolystoma xenopodis]
MLSLRWPFEVEPLRIVDFVSAPLIDTLARHLCLVANFPGPTLACFAPLFRNPSGRIRVFLCLSSLVFFPSFLSGRLIHRRALSLWPISTSSPFPLFSLLPFLSLSLSFVDSFITSLSLSL